MKSTAANSRLSLYGVGVMLAGAILVVLGPPVRSERPGTPHPEDLWVFIPGWSLMVLGMALIICRIVRGVRAARKL